MSTYRDISTLPLDALRSVTYSADTAGENISYGEERRSRNASRNTSRERDLGEMPTMNAGISRSQTSSLLATNEKLYDENRKMRRCLSLFLENSQLKTMNILSSAMSMCDDQLRNFITEKLTSADISSRNTTKDVNSQTYEQYNNERASSSDYGKSFDQLSMSDLRNSTFPQSPKFPTKMKSPREIFSSISSSPLHQPLRSPREQFSSVRHSSLRPPMRSPLEKFSSVRSSSLPPPMRSPHENSTLSSSTSLRPTLRFSFPYDRSPPKFPTAESFSRSHRSDEYRSPGEGRPQSSSQYRNKDSVNNNTREMQTPVISPASTHSTLKSVLKRPKSAPTLLEKTEHITVHNDRNAQAYQTVKSVRSCMSCGINLQPTCKCLSCSPRSAVVAEDKTSMCLNDTCTSLSSNTERISRDIHYKTQYSPHGIISASKNNSNYPQDKTERVVQKHVSRSINFTPAPKDQTNKTTPDDDFVIKKVRQEKKQYITAANDSMELSIQSSSTIDDNQTTDDMDGASVDFDPHKLHCSAFRPVKSEYGPRSQTAFRNKSDRHVSYGRIGTPIATSTPLPSPVKRDYSSRTLPSRSISSTFSKREPGLQSMFHDDFWKKEKGVLHASDTTVRPQGTKQLSHSLADVMGITGRGSPQKANYVFHRPVDILIGYNPSISEDATLSLAVSRPNKRVVGEVAFQLDRRILEYVFAHTSDKHSSKRQSRYYGYSVASIKLLIGKEVRHAGSASSVERTLTFRLELVRESLHRFGYILEHHSEFTQDMVNKYGLLNGAPDPDTVEAYGLSEPAVLRVLFARILKDEQELADMLIILDCLHYMAHKDKRPLFMW